MLIELTAGEDRVSVDDHAGGRLAALNAGGAQRLITQIDGPLSWGAFPLIPWAGRVADAHIAAAHSRGSEVHLGANHGPHAIHGVVYDQRWEIEDQADDELQLRCALPVTRWPFGGEALQRFNLAPGRLRLRIDVRAGDSPMPVSVGWHPWFARPVTGDMAVLIDSAAVLETTADLIPTGRVVEAAGDLDLRHGPPLDGRRLDHCYLDVQGPAQVYWPDLVLTMELPRSPGTVVVHTPMRGVCVEPQTAWPDPFSRPERSGVTWLEPGEVFAATTEWTWRRR